MITHAVTHRGTVYRIHVFTTGTEDDEQTGGWRLRFILAESGWSSGHGEWVRLDVDSIALSYLREKMPETWHREGDWPGWKMAFAKAGVHVFGVPGDDE